MKSVSCTVKPIEFWLNKRDKLGWIKFPAYADIKYDGEYCMADTLNLTQSGLLINGYGKARVDGPILRELPSDSVVFGELYFDKGHNGDLYKLLSNKMSDDLMFAAFDAQRLNGYDISNKTFEERRTLLIDAIGKQKHVHVVDSYYLESPADVDSAYDEAIQRGFEGVVIKQANQVLNVRPKCTWVKLKYTTMADLMVVAIDPSKERIECQLPGNGIKTLGVKVMNNIKATLKVGDIVEIQHYGVLNGGGLRHPVFMRKRDANKRVSVDI
jgi:hypothetical protein